LGGGEGTKEICKMIASNQHLRKINLSGMRVIIVNTFGRIFIVLGNKFNELDVTELVEAFDVCFIFCILESVFLFLAKYHTT